MITKTRNLRKLEDEQWRFIPGSNNRYQVSNYGRIKSFANNKKQGQILIANDIKGFSLIRLHFNTVIHRYYVHKLVAEVWIPKPSERHTLVTHLDGQMKNNHVSNLEWHTKESLVKKHREYAKKRDEDTDKTKTPKGKNTKLTISDIELLKSMLQRGVVQSKIAKLFRISEMQVTRIKRGENWGHVKIPDEEKNKV